MFKPVGSLCELGVPVEGVWQSTDTCASLVRGVCPERVEAVKTVLLKTVQTVTSNDWLNLRRHFVRRGCIWRGGQPPKRGSSMEPASVACNTRGLYMAYRKPGLL